MQPGLILNQGEDRRWTLARQIGVDHAVAGIPSTEDGWSVAFDPLLEMKNSYEDAGLKVSVIEGRPPMQDIMVGGPERDEQVESVKELLRNMGRLDIPVWCVAWMANHGWARTATAVPDRGNSLVTALDMEDLRKAPDVGDVSEATLWENMERFLDEVVPVAEEAGVKLAWHPDDPPLSPFRGVGRILTSPENFERVLDLYDSPNNGITFCQGNFAAMGVDVPETIRTFGDDIHFVHFRDVEGTAENFRETWHDDGPTDMAAAMRAYEDVGYDGVMRPDHVPTMAGEDNDRPGYEMQGRLFAVGYMKGLIDQIESDAGDA